MASELRDSSHGSLSSDPYTALDLNESGIKSTDKPRVLSVLSLLLERAVVRNERYEIANSIGIVKPYGMTAFHGLCAPSISIRKYVERIFKYANCSPSCFVVAYAYLDRFVRQKPGILITNLNVHRLLITSVMVAAKFLDDSYYNNAYYAKVGGVTTEEMNSLELEFLFSLEFRLQVTVSVFESYCTHLEREVTREGAYQIEKSLQIGCSVGGANAQHRDQKQRLAVRCRYPEYDHIYVTTAN